MCLDVRNIDLLRVRFFLNQMMPIISMIIKAKSFI